MIETNVLLGFALSLISNFTQVVCVPPNGVPQSTNDIGSYRIGFFSEPLTMGLAHKNGTTFWIRNGVVMQYETAGEFFGLQDPGRIPEFLGPAKLSTNEVMDLASNTVRRLVKSGDPLANVTPLFKPAGLYHGQVIPFYEVIWPHPEWDEMAKVQIDARTGLIVSLILLEDRFSDFAYAAEISNRVYKPDPSTRHSPRESGRTPRRTKSSPASAIGCVSVKSWVSILASKLILLT